MHIREPKTRRVAGRAAQQHVLLECPGQHHEILNSWSRTPNSNLENHCSSSLRLLWARTPQSWRVTSRLHAPRLSRRCSHGSLASTPWLTTITPQRPFDLWKDPWTSCSRRNVPASIKTGPPKKLQTPFSQGSRLDSLQSNTSESPAISPFVHHVGN